MLNNKKKDIPEVEVTIVQKVYPIGNNMYQLIDQQVILPTKQQDDTPTATGAKTRDDLVGFCMNCKNNIYANEKHGICEPLTEKECHEFRKADGEWVRVCVCQPTGKGLEYVE